MLQWRLLTNPERSALEGLTYQFDYSWLDGIKIGKTDIGGRREEEGGKRGEQRKGKERGKGRAPVQTVVSNLYFHPNPKICRICRCAGEGILGSVIFEGGGGDRGIYGGGGSEFST